MKFKSNQFDIGNLIPHTFLKIWTVDHGLWHDNMTREQIWKDGGERGKSAALKLQRRFFWGGQKKAW